MIVGNAYGFAITTGQSQCFALLASTIDRTNGMDDIFRGQTASSSEDSFSGGQRADLLYDAPALFKDGRPSRAMDRAVDTAPAQQGGIGRIDNGFQ